MRQKQLGLEEKRLKEELDLLKENVKNLELKLEDLQKDQGTLKRIDNRLQEGIQAVRAVYR